MRASSDSWRGSIDRRSSADASYPGGGTQKVQKHQCLFAACVPAKECGPEEVKCVPNSVVFVGHRLLSLRHRKSRAPLLSMMILWSR